LNALHRGKLSSRYTLEAFLLSKYSFLLAIWPQYKVFWESIPVESSQAILTLLKHAAQKMRVLLTRLRLDRAQTEDDNFLCPHINKSLAHAQMRL
jgi:ABC-type enterobactin transport system permease subunit